MDQQLQRPRHADVADRQRVDRRAYDYDADDLRKISRTDLNQAQPLKTYYVHGLGQLLAEYQKRGTGAIGSTHDYIYAGSRLIASAAPRLTTPHVEWTTPSATVPENVGTYTPRVALRVPAGGPIAGPLSVFFRTDAGTASGADYTDPAGGGFFTTFPAGSVDGAERNMNPVQIFQDARNDDDEETVIISLYNVSGGRIGARSRQTLTIVDDDPLPVLNITGDQAVTEGSTVNLTITTTVQSNQAIFVDWSVSDPTGCGASIGGVVEIVAGAFSATLSVPIPLNGYASQGTRLVQVFLANPARRDHRRRTGDAHRRGRRYAGDDGSDEAGALPSRTSEARARTFSRSAIPVARTCRSR